MPGLMIAWEYLTGYAVATDPSSREHAEWPPHPGRVFMAMAAAWFETGEDAAEGDALRWLETLGDPELRLPPREQVGERSNVMVFVPVNDKAGPSAATLQSAPAITRSKQSRTFPRVHVSDALCVMHWPEAEGVDAHRDALDRLCGKVTRIGHSSSMVSMWLAEAAELNRSDGERLIPDDQFADLHARSISKGTLQMLIERFGEVARGEHTELKNRIDALEASRKAVKGKGARERNAAIKTEIETLEERLAGIVSRPPIRPKLGLSSGYRRADSPKEIVGVKYSTFDTDVLVLTHVAGPTLPVVSTLAVTRALRGAVMSHSGIQPVPRWVSGHEPNGDRSQAESGHLACIPLPFVGSEHADGHLLGVGLVFPRSVDRRERGRALGKLILERNTGQPRSVELTLGRLGVWSVSKRDWTEKRSALQPETWTANPDGETTWASVTPVVLDRFPKVNRLKDRAGWTEEVAAIVAAACTRIGLPGPVGIDIDTTSWHVGSPRAFGKRRPLRGRHGADDRDAGLGDGFPSYPPKGTNASRPQVHAWLRFSEPVVGPVLLGAGRFQGYGLCKPLPARNEAGR